MTLLRVYSTVKSQSGRLVTAVALFVRQQNLFLFKFTCFLPKLKYNLIYQEKVLLFDALRSRARAETSLAKRSFAVLAPALLRELQLCQNQQEHRFCNPSWIDLLDLRVLLCRTSKALNLTGCYSINQALALILRINARA